jgi:hypothetical protein
LGVVPPPWPAEIWVEVGQRIAHFLQKYLVNARLVEAAQLPTVNIDKEMLVRFEPMLVENFGVCDVEKERGLANASLPDQGDALSIAEQGQSLAHLVLAVKEVSTVADGTTVKKGV